MGTLRRNLDILGEYDDASLNAALHAVGLSDLASASTPTPTQERARTFSLDSQIEVGGRNLSVGQRQLVALARAIVRQSKLLILDEATSAIGMLLFFHDDSIPIVHIDHESDEHIQTTLRKEVGPDVTVLIVAHRLPTVIDADKIVGISCDIDTSDTDPP